MPGYDEHRRRAEIVAAVVAPALAVAVWLWTGRVLLTVAAAGLCFVAITVGNLLPDVDSPTSVPRRRLVRLLQLAVVAGVGGSAVTFADVALDAAERVTRSVGIPLAPTPVVAVAVVLMALMGARIVPRLLDRLLPSHRGPLHDVRLWALLVGGVVAAIYAFDGRVFGTESLQRDVLVAAAAVGLLVGIAVHLAADGELWS